MSLFLTHYHPQDHLFSYTLLNQITNTSPLSTYEHEHLTVIAHSHLLKPCAASPSSDAALIATQYQKKKEQCFKQLQGGFSCVIWDKTTRELTLVKDPMGQYPLFYSQTSHGSIYISNSVKPLLENAQVPKQLDATNIAKFLVLITPDSTNTCFEHIKKIPYGSFLRFQPNGKPISSKFWSAAHIAANPLHLTRAQDYYSEFRELYQTVIHELLRGKSNIASHLSGGLDSTSVTNISASFLKTQNQSLYAIAHAPEYPEKVKAKPNWNHDDRFYIEAAAQFSSNINLCYTTINQPLFHYTKELHPFMDQPPLNPSNTLWLLEAVKTAKALGCRYLLTGQGGNSTISWPLYSALKKSRTPWSMKKLIRHFPGKIYHHYHRKKQSYQPHAPWQIFSAVHPELASHVHLETYFAHENAVRKRRKQDRYTYYELAFQDYITSINAAFEQCYGMTHLDPTVDKRIIEFFLRTPSHVFEDDTGRNRLLVREGLQGLMPDCVLQRTTRGMQASDWFYWLEAHKATILDHLHHWQNTNVSHYINLPHLIKLMNKWDITQASQGSGKRFDYFNSQYQQKVLRAIEMGLFIEEHTG